MGTPVQMRPQKGFSDGFLRRPAEADVVYLDIGGKQRPAILLRKMPGYGDFLVCAVSSQLKQYIRGFDEKIEPSKDTGIIVKSVIRLGCLELVKSKDIPGRSGRIPAEQHRRLLKKLSAYLISTKTTTPV